MNKVQTIVKLQRESAQLDEDSNVRRWCEAQLIYEELQHRSFRDLSTAIKEAGGSGSLRHLQLMKKCWEDYGQGLWDAGNEDFVKYPRLNELYNSDEVRGEPDDEDDGETGSRGGNGERGKRRPSGDYSAHGLVVQAYGAIDALVRVKAHHELLTEEDLDLLRELPSRIRALLRTIG